MRHSRLFITLFLLASIALTSAVITFSQDTENADLPIIEENDEAAEGEFTVGVITLSPPEDYIIVEEVKTKKKRLYKKAAYEEIEDENLKPLQTVTLDAIEYRYRPVQKKVEFVSEQFELFGLKDKKAILKRDYIDTPVEVIEETEAPQEIIEAQPVEEPPAEEPKKEITAKRLIKAKIAQTTKAAR